MWQYTKQQQGEEGAPPVALKTRRSLRAVHFHPLGLPLVLTAEVNDVNTPVTLPHVAPSIEAAAAAAPADSQPATQLPPEASVPRVQFSDAPAQDVEPQHVQHAQRMPHRRLSEVFRAMMDEEHEEELLAQLESSVSLHTGHPHASASRQILSLAGRAEQYAGRAQSSVQLPSRNSMHSATSDSVPIRQPRPRRPVFHPLAHTEDQDLSAFRVR